MAKELIEIKGFAELEAKIKQLPDKVKKREMLKILGQVANPTLAASQNQVPLGTGVIKVDGKSYKRKNRQVGKKPKKYNNPYEPGTLKKSLGKITGKRGLGRENAVIYVAPRAGKNKKFDGFYGKFVTFAGGKNTKKNDFMNRAYEQTKGGVTANAEVKVTKYIQKQIDRLSK